ncbi:hypothetical protein BDW72DRAFT_189690 [Aspergillus terricola var. indicus]
MDHETTGALEWQLVTHGRAAKKKTALSNVQAQASQAPQALSSNTTQSGPQRRLPPTVSGTPGPSSRVALATQKLPSVRCRETPNVRGQGTPRGRGATLERPASGRSKNPLQYPPAKLKYVNGSDPDGVVELPAPFGTFKHEFFGSARVGTLLRKSAAGQGRNEVFEDISKRSGAFIKLPAYGDRTIRIWGEPIQVAAAKGQLQSILAKCHSLNKAKSRNEFVKIRAYSERKEANAESKEKGEGILHELRKPPESSIPFPEQLFFLWPKYGPSLNECFGPELESLDSIRARFGCHLFILKELPNHICALGKNHDDMKQIAKSIRVLWAEETAKSNIKAKIYLVEPQPRAMEGKIVVEKRNLLHHPMLQGGRLQNPDLLGWQERIRSMQSNNNARILTAVEDCLKGLAFVRGHLRMRVNLGTFVLENYQKPENDKSWYDFGEFRDMLLHEQTQGRLIPRLKIGQPELLERCFKAKHLFEPLDDASTALEDAELAYSVNFEFLGADKSMLRLEAEFAKSPGAREYEIKERRWLRPRTDGQTRDKRPPLHVAAIDFERSDWRLEIKALEFHEASSIDNALKSFSNSVGFQRTNNFGDIRARPEKKVTFPLSPPVSRYVEKSAIRYRIKGTKYIFEIARYDEYRRSGAGVRCAGDAMLGSMSESPYTFWGASVFDANWDNLLGGHANLPVGQSAKYSPNLATFFPSREPLPVPENQTKGFWEFIGLVKQAAELLGPTQTSAEDAKMNAVSEAGSSSQKAGPAVSPAAPAPNLAKSPQMLNEDLGTLF